MAVEKADAKVGAMMTALKDTQYDTCALRWRVDSGMNSLWHEFPLPRQPNIQPINTTVRPLTPFLKCLLHFHTVADASQQHVGVLWQSCAVSATLLWGTRCSILGLISLVSNVLPGCLRVSFMIQPAAWRSADARGTVG